MKIILTCLVVSTLLTVAYAKEPPAFSSSTQMIIVNTNSWDAPQGTLRRYEREHPGSLAARRRADHCHGRQKWAWLGNRCA
jgi:hypothetical protein